MMCKNACPKSRLRRDAGGYDPALGRWWQQDPKIKENFSSYAWVTNNPILFFDFLGLDSAAAALLTQAAETAVQEIVDSDPEGRQPPMCNVGVVKVFRDIAQTNELDQGGNTDNAKLASQIKS